MLIEKPRFPIREILLYGFWPGFIKKWIYRLKGYRIGRHVSLGPGSVIVGRDVEIGEYTKLGFLTVLRGTTIKIGPHVQIGSTTIFDTPHLEIGEGTRINEQVFVGGLQYPDSRLVVGKNCQIMQMSFINPARTITIGDDSGVGGHSLIFGHTSWLSRFEGYPVEFSDIEIGRSVSLAWRVFVLPGTKIGDGAVIGANSLVARTIPPRCLAVGFPARVVSKAPDFPKTLTTEEKIELLREIVDETAEYLRMAGLAAKIEGDRLIVTSSFRRFLQRRSRQWVLQVAYSSVRESTPVPPCDVFMSLAAIPSGLRTSLDRARVFWIDIENKERSTIPTTSAKRWRSS